MKTPSYNPSPLEVELTNILSSLIPTINDQLKDMKISTAKINLKADNPALAMEILDNDGDIHSVVIKIIQRPDEYLI